MVDEEYRKSETTAGTMQQLPALSSASPLRKSFRTTLSTLAPRTPAQRYLAIVAAISTAVVMSAWVWANYGKMWFLDTEYTTWRAKMDMVENCASAETVFVGDSQVMAGIIPSMVGKNSLNLAMGGASPIETYYQVRKLLRCPNPPKRILLSFSPGTQIWAEFYWTRAAYFSYFTLEEMEEIRAASEHLGDTQLYPDKAFRQLRGQVKNVSFDIAVPFHYAAAMLNAGVFARRWHNEQEYAATIEGAGHRFVGLGQSALWPSPASAFSGFTPGLLQDYYFNRLLSLLAEKKIDVYYAAMPESELTQGKMPPAVAAQLSAYVEALSRKHGNFHVLIKPFTFLPPSYFGDSEHLNETGAKYWSDVVGKRLAEADTSNSRPR